MHQAPLASCKDLEKSFGGSPLFMGITLGIFPAERLGLIGANGSGKSTLLKLMAGMDDADEGDLVFQKGIKRIYLPQHSHLEPNLTCDAALAQYQPVDDPDIRGLMLSEAGFPDPNQRVEQLSGGWRKRLHILSALIQEPDLLFLDEPTNHLDLEGILWLEGILKAPSFAFVLVSHDRAFLQDAVSRIIELSHHYEKGYFEVQGGYQDFIERKAIYLEGQAKQEDTIKNKAKREKEWLQKGPKARTTKARSRVDEAHRLQAELRRLRGLNRDQDRAGIEFVHTDRGSKKLVEAYNLSKALGEKPLFSGLKFKLGPRERLGLLGPNGSGKSTLMRLIQGEIEPDEGSLKLAHDLKIVYFDQDRKQLTPSETLYRALCPEGDSVVYQGKSVHVYTWAKRFLFESDRLEQPISSLSGGEQARVLIARLMLISADVLLLDEPTNDLDIPALEVLEESLNEFPGAILLVTHDRFLLNQVSTRILSLDGQGGAEFYPDYEQWSSRQGFGAKPTKPTKTKVEKAKSGLTYQEQKEFAKIENKIQKQEQKLEKLELSLHDPDLISDAEALADAYAKVEKEKANLDQIYARWEELEQKSQEG